MNMTTQIENAISFLFDNPTTNVKVEGFNYTTDENFDITIEYRPSEMIFYIEYEAHTDDYDLYENTDVEISENDDIETIVENIFDEINSEWGDISVETINDEMCD